MNILFSDIYIYIKEACLLLLNIVKIWVIFTLVHTHTPTHRMKKYGIKIYLKWH